MKLVIQRVIDANLKVDNKEISKIGKGYVVLIGIKDSDTKENADYLVNKLHYYFINFIIKIEVLYGW